MVENNSGNDLKVEVLPEDYSNYDLSFKIIVIGDSGVGKSCLTMRATKNLFDNNYNATVGFEFFTFNTRINNQVVKLQVWDTCGQEIYRSLITNFYRNSSLAIMVYSIDNKESFDNIDVWLKELKTHASPDAKVFVIGNKIDLDEKRKVTKETADKYKNDYKLDYFTECSAKSGMNARDVFVEASKILYTDYLKYRDSRSSSIVSNSSSFRQKTVGDNKSNSVLEPSKMQNTPTKKKGCC
mmetsp:Transcript_22852/g.23800  ORF Transcript_22852/g.23800 Transcript_22852/m.23800 type:complete len:240 (+) Transcript_22852:13-732(+)